MKNLMFIVTLLLSTIGCGKPGPEGGIGPTGSTGTQGPAGNPGLNSPGVVAIELCPGFTPSYPNVFPEYALCVSNELYGVYSIPNAFMTKLPPGVYSSVGINATCTLTIAPNCSVTRD